MRKLLIIFIISVFHFSFLKAEVIKNVIINGNKRISNETVIIYGDIKIEKNYSEEDLNNLIKNLYSTNFLRM